MHSLERYDDKKMNANPKNWSTPEIDMPGHGDYLRPIDIAMPPNESNDTIN